MVDPTGIYDEPNGRLYTDIGVEFEFGDTFQANCPTCHWDFAQLTHIEPKGLHLQGNFGTAGTLHAFIQPNCDILWENVKNCQVFSHACTLNV